MIGRYYDPRENRTHFAEVYVDELVKDQITPEVREILQSQADEMARANDPNINYWRQVAKFVAQRDTMQKECGEDYKRMQELTRYFDKILNDFHHSYWDK